MKRRWGGMSESRFPRQPCSRLFEVSARYTPRSLEASSSNWLISETACASRTPRSSLMSRMSSLEPMRRLRKGFGSRGARLKKGVGFGVAGEYLKSSGWTIRVLAHHRSSYGWVQPRRARRPVVSKTRHPAPGRGFDYRPLSVESAYRSPNIRLAG